MDAKTCGEYENHKKRFAKFGLELLVEGELFVIQREQRSKFQHKGISVATLEELRLVADVLDLCCAFFVGQDVSEVLTIISKNARHDYPAFSNALDKAIEVAPKKKTN